MLMLSYSIAWAELYLIFGHIFRRLEMETVSTRCVVNSFTVQFFCKLTRICVSSLDDFCGFKDYFVPIHQGRQLQIRSKQAPR